MWDRVFVKEQRDSSWNANDSWIKKSHRKGWFTDQSQQGSRKEDRLSSIWFVRA
jgi:hypothetical protein